MKEAIRMPSSGPVATGVQMPKVSVIIGNFNQGKFAGDTIRSVAAQTYDNLECVIVDDMSTDGSRGLIETALSELGDDRFRFIPRDVNGGQMAAMLTGLDATRAPFVAFVDADDIWCPDFLEHHVAAHLSASGTAAISSSHMMLIDEAGALIASESPNAEGWANEKRTILPKYITFAGEGLERLAFVDRRAKGWLWTVTSAMMFRRNAIAALRPASPEKIRIQADSFWAYGAHMLGGTVRLERALGYYRLHGANSWANSGYFGSGSRMGVEDADVAATIQQELTRTFCAVAPGLERSLETGQLARAFANYVGWPQAIRLHDSNAAARALLSGWAKPSRRFATLLATTLPRGLRPRQVVIKRRLDRRGAPSPIARARRRIASGIRPRDAASAGIDAREKKFVRSVYGPYLLDTPDDRTFELCVTGYGRLLPDLLENHDRDYLFLDIGANCGIFSLLAAAQPHCRKVIAIEPVPPTFDRLTANIAYNDAEKVRAVRGAVSDSRRAFLHLTYDPGHSGMATIAARSRRNTVTAPVLDARALSGLVDGAPDSIVVKIDVEGSETRVLSVLRKAPFFAAVSDIVIEISERHSGSEGVSSILQILSEEGFDEIAREGPAEHYDAHYRRHSQG
jgi:FkbM family methyltransferase